MEGVGICGALLEVSVANTKGKRKKGGQIQKWRTSGQIGYITPAVLGVPNASERGTKSAVAHKWAD